MTEQECREIFRKDCDEKMKPLVKQMTNLVMQAYEYGLDLGLSTANQIIESNQSDWKDRHPRKGLWDSNKVLAWISQNIESYCKLDAENFNNLLFDLRKAMED